MRSMIYYEFQKIFRRKLNIIAMLAGLLLMLVCAVNYVRQTSFYDAETNSYVRGTEAFRRQEKAKAKMTDVLTEEYLTGVVMDIQEQNMDLASDVAYLEIIRPQSDLLHMLCRNYMDVGEEIEWNQLNEIPTENGIHFYERRLEKVENYLNRDFSYGNYSEAEKAFWMEKENEVQTPFLWGDTSVMDCIWSLIEIGFYFMFVIAVCIAPVFASEYESGAAALLLTTKYGKTKLICAKIFTAVLFSLVYVAAGIGMGVAIVGIMVGFHGAELPVQLWYTIIPYNWTIGKTLIVSFAMMLLIALTITLFTLFLSSRVKGSLGTLVIVFVLLVGPAVLPMSKECGLWNHINYLFPVRVMMTEDVICTLNSYSFGPVVFSYLGMAVLVYLLVSVLCFLGIDRARARGTRKRSHAKLLKI